MRVGPVLPLICLLVIGTGLSSTTFHDAQGEPIGPYVTLYPSTGSSGALEGSLPYGDIDGDGRSDFVVTYPSSDGGNGSAEVYLGSSNSPGIVISSRIDGGGIGSGLVLADLDADGKDDIILLDKHHKPFVIMGRTAMQQRYDLDEGDAFMNSSLEGLRSTWAGPDGYQDLVFIQGDGTPAIFEGPVLGTSLPTSLRGYGPCDGVLPFDPDSDGIDELAIGVRNGSGEDLYVIEQMEGTVIYRTSFSFHFSLLCPPDMDGDGCDDLVMHAHSASSYGSLIVLSGSGISGRSDDLSAKAVLGSADDPLTSPLTAGSADIDADHFDDLVIGRSDAFSGKGAIDIILGSGSIFDETALSIEAADAKYSGEGTLMGVGRGMVAGMDIDGDLHEDVVLVADQRLSRLKLPSSSSPGDVQSGHIFLDDPGIPVESAEHGSRIGIRLRAVDLSPSTIDLARVTVGCVGSVSSVVLAESGTETGDLQGFITLSDVSRDGRSIACTQRDTVTVSAPGWSGSIQVLGNYRMDDPPILVGGTHLEAREGRPFVQTIEFFEPEGENVSVSAAGLPDWLSFNGSVLQGVPGNADVGTTSITFNASSGALWSEADVEIEVLNAFDGMVPVLFPHFAREGDLYLATFEKVGDMEGARIMVVQSGPSGGWLSADLNGSVTGTPRNMDVGMWNMSLVLDDQNGGVSTYNWSVQVNNTAPAFDPIDVSHWTEWEPMVIDVNGTGEGDGWTNYSLLEGEATSFDNGTGVLRAVPYIRSSEKVFIARVRAYDGHGEHADLEVRIGIDNVAPVLLGSLPSRVKAWELTKVIVPTNEDDVSTIGFVTDPPMPYLTVKQATGASMLILGPLNMDAGNATYTLGIVDEWGARRNYTWELSVDGNGTSTDPEFDILYARWSSSTSIKVGFSIQPGDAEIGEVQLQVGELAVISPTERDISRGYVVVPVGDDADLVNITMVVVFEIEGGIVARDISISRTFDPGDRPSGGISSGPIVIAVVAAIVLILVGIALLVERTSYPLQVLLLKGGAAREDEVLTAIQTRPGITWNELLRTTGIGRREAASTMESLEAGGYIYEQPMGMRIHFYPMMGSFKDRPLSLTRHQGQIAKALLASPRGMDENDISAATGIPPARVRKECNLMELKGALTVIRRPTLDVYRLSHSQREKLKRWAGSE